MNKQSPKTPQCLPGPQRSMLCQLPCLRLQNSKCSVSDQCRWKTPLLRQLFPAMQIQAGRRQLFDVGLQFARSSYRGPKSGDRRHVFSTGSAAQLLTAAMSACSNLQIVAHDQRASALWPTETYEPLRSTYRHQAMANAPGSFQLLARHHSEPKHRSARQSR